MEGIEDFIGTFDKFKKRCRIGSNVGGVCVGRIAMRCGGRRVWWFRLTRSIELGDSRMNHPIVPFLLVELFFTLAGKVLYSLS